ncbi:TetR/AcrR family transcriptional regulator [Methylopila sp. M107]|uniref:TetR/AcrR family transcriptional regulator n=1 Tax=Methylopila sp. M107 TaxID=1101190 RepID=UPI00037DEC06|nr:TetR/AcrR family transcriptional regulator [Methylopila sp. M107]
MSANMASPEPVVEDRRKARGAKSRALILERAAAIASTDGLDGLTIGRLATEAGVAKSNVQVLFGDKEALQLATIDWVGQIHDATIVGPARAEASPLARARAMVENWFAFVERRQLPGGCFMNAVSSEFRARPGAIRDRVAGRRAEKRRRYVETLRDAQDAGEIGVEIDPDELAFELLAFQALANIAFTIGDDEEFERARALSRKRLDVAASSA